MEIEEHIQVIRKYENQLREAINDCQRHHDDIVIDIEGYPDPHITISRIPSDGNSQFKIEISQKL